MIPKMKYYQLVTFILFSLLSITLSSSCSDDAKEIECPTTAKLEGDKCIDNDTGEEVPPIASKDCGGICSKSLAKLTTDVDEIVFSTVGIDQSDTQYLVISNNGEGTLKVFAVKLVENTKDDKGGEEFSKGEGWKDSFEIEPGDYVEVGIDYSPKDTSADDGYLEIVSNDPTRPNLKLDVVSQRLAARVFSNPTINFQRVPPVSDSTRDTSWLLSSIKNIGEAPLTIEDITISPTESDFKISFPVSDEIGLDPKTDTASWPEGKLAPNESFPIRIYFNPDTADPSEAELHIFSDDPVTKDYKVTLSGNSDDACLKVVSGEDEINFGEGGIGFANNKTITLENCSNGKNLNVSDLKICTDVAGACDPLSEIFQLKSPLPENIDQPQGMVLGPQDTVSFVAVYTPTDLSVSEGKLKFTSTDPIKSSVIIPLKGKGTNNACPTAVADAKIAGSNRYQTGIHTTPLKVIEFRASGSTDSDGRVARYEWTILSDPNGSTERLSNPNIANPTLQVNLAGEYIVELRVFDDKGTASCGDQALVKINVTSDQDVHIQLVWRTPTDADETDAFGTDVDAHYLHSSGRWNSNSDVYYRNKNPNWTTPKPAPWVNPGTSDDPKLNRDDTNGSGPEDITHDNLEAAVYSVGVHYYTDNGFGPSYATIRIFIGGIKVFEALDQQLPKKNAFWHVATLSWPSKQISFLNNLMDRFP